MTFKIKQRSGQEHTTQILTGCPWDGRSLDLSSSVGIILSNLRCALCLVGGGHSHYSLHQMSNEYTPVTHRRATTFTLTHEYTVTETCSGMYLYFFCCYECSVWIPSFFNLTGRVKITIIIKKNTPPPVQQKTGLKPSNSDPVTWTNKKC